MSFSSERSVSKPAYVEKLLRRNSKTGESSRRVEDLFLHLGYGPDPATAGPTYDDLIAAQARLNDRLLDLSALQDGMRVLDVGCGLGGTLASVATRFQGMDLIGLNIDPEQLEIARHHVRPGANNRCDWILGNASSLPFADASVDRILAIECVFHFPSRQGFFAEVARVLKPGGVLVLSDFTTAASLRQLRDSESYPGFALEAAILPEVGPWPDFWEDKTDAESVAATAGLQLVSREDISRQTLPSYTCFLQGKIDTDRADVTRLDGVDRAMVVMEWLQERGHLAMETFSFSRPTLQPKEISRKARGRATRRVALLCLDPAEDEGVLSLNYSTR
jgi:ubiquinone/menaquinone biosynthesis C-methylase UbiE